MPRGLRIKLRARQFRRRHQRLVAVLRSFMIFSAAFGGAYGFVIGSRTDKYDPHMFAIGVSGLFALACVALATMSFRMRMLRKAMRAVVARNEALIDRN